jgi:hypothetical protein
MRDGDGEVAYKRLFHAWRRGAVAITEDVEIGISEVR